MKTATNDVHSEDFESKMDQFFTQAIKSNRWGKYSQWDKDLARSALATKKPIKPNRSRFWCKGELGVSSPVRQRP